MSDNIIILSESHELVIAPNLNAKSSAVKQMILDGVMGEIKRKEVIDWRDLEPFEDKETYLWGYKSKKSSDVAIEAKYDLVFDFEEYHFNNMTLQQFQTLPKEEQQKILDKGQKEKELKGMLKEIQKNMGIPQSWINLPREAKIRRMTARLKGETSQLKLD